ncbi:MAG: translocation/assembly module TamB domain-containing protein [Longimicrobiales bacterium]
MEETSLHPEAPAPGEGENPRRKRPRRRWERRVLLALFALGVALGVAGTALVKSGPGQRMVLGAVMGRVRGSLAGSLTVDSIHSRSLLGAAMLVGVTLDAAGGRRFLEADSVEVRYSVFSLFGAPPRIAAATLYGPRVEISRYHGEENANVAGLLAPRSTIADAVPGRGLALGSIRVVDGHLDVLTPLEGEASPRMPVVQAPDSSGTLRRLTLEGVNLELEDVRLGGSGGQLLTGHLADLAMDVWVLDRPLTITHAEGAVRFGPAGLELQSASFRSPSSAFEGSFALGPSEEGEGPWGVFMELRAQGPASLSDLAWLDERIPEGVFHGGVDVTVLEGLEVDFQDARVEAESSRLTLDGVIGVDGSPVFRDLEIQAAPLDLDLLDPWLEADLPIAGWVSGSLRMSGSLEAMETRGRVTLVPRGMGGGPTTADVSGTVHLGDDPGATNLRVVLDPLNLELVRAWRPTLLLEGPARAEVDASGRLAEGIRFLADLGHGSDPGASHVVLSGSARRGEGLGWVLDVHGELAPLSFALLHQLAPAVSPEGAVSGPVQVVGSLGDLRITGQLATSEGTVAVDGRMDLANPSGHYRLEADALGLALSGLVEGLPHPSLWTGRLELEGRGLRPESLEASGFLDARGSRVGGLLLDTLATRVRISGGVLAFDTLAARIGGFDVTGSGTLGLVEGAPGEARLAFRTGDLVGLRSLFMGEAVTARDTLSVLERELLRLQGVDADTFPLLEEVAVSGTMEGEVTLTGSLSTLGVEGTLRLRDGVYGADRVGSADVRVEARDVTGPGRVVAVTLDAGEVTLYGRSLGDVRADVRLEGQAGEGTVSSEPAEGERYALEGSFSLDSLGGGDVRLEQTTLLVDAREWHLLRPGRVQWNSTSVTLTDVELGQVAGKEREEGDAMSLRAEGTLAWEGISDLRVTAKGVRLDHLARLAQREKLSMGGLLDLSLRVTGPAGSPAIEGSFDVAEPRWGDLALTALHGELGYADREARVQLTATEGSRSVLRAEGTVPVDLALRPEGRRIVARPMDVRVRADSLRASVALRYLAFLEGVQGSVSGDFRIRGVLDRPEPTGVLTLEDAGWSIEALGVRHSDVTGTLTLNPDRTVDVAVDGRAVGTSTVRGKVVLEPLNDPRLDLTIGLRGFEAVGRRDVAGIVSGEVRLLGSYRAPRVEGALSVDQGTLFLEEFVRTAEVVDLTDPRIFEVVDTTALSTRPLLAGIRNPFLQNLRVDVDLSVPRDTWLRSADMNVEIGGDLLVRYDRLSRDIVMVGELQALRGSYMVLGRRFDVQGGTVGFEGTPGINPTLDIQATARIRRVEGAPFVVNASVQGNLIQPRVTLSSGEQGVAQSDLVSYLIFGRPSYELATGQEAWLSGAAGSFVGAASEAGVSFLSGTLAARLGSVLSQQIGLDYLAISQAGDFGVVSGSLGGSLAGTQIEVGQYLGERVFFVLIFRPLSGQTSGQSFFGGARVEVALTDNYNVQAFWEDRFLRSRVGGFGDLGIQASQVVGVFVFREWGY